ncbi:uncharacterized protein [Temnothorax longispinosus]|uniref:uncharacterized protein n=1 Tax=Temnothorax longispinosus TaxID=300112 RepID=UPI003A9A36F2
MWLFLKKLGNVIMDQTIDLKRLHNNEEVRSVRSRKSIERDVKIFEAQIDLISGRLPLQQFLRMFIGKLDDYRWKESFTVQSKAIIAQCNLKVTNIISVIKLQNMEAIKGKHKDSTVYIYEGYTYHIDKRLEGTYRCSTRRNTSCQGLAIVSEDGQVTVTSLHDHPPNDMVARTSKLKQEIYRLCQESIQPIKKIFDDVCERDPEAAMHLSYPAIKSTLNRMRAAYKPPVPNSFASLSLELEKYDACKDIYKGTVIAEDGSMGFLFSNNELLNALNESTQLFVDGTFSIVPRKPNIIQLYTIHIRYMNTGIATIFVLCESRTKALYRAIWEKIIKLAPALQNNVKFIMGDYEKAAIATLSEFFPVAAIHGCWFHFNQSILRKLRQLKLTNAPKTLISMAMSVPLVLHIKFEEAFAILQRTADNMCDDHPAVLQFMSYMRNTWQNISEKVSVYNCPVRTNNLVESFHNQASKHFGKHTNLWIFIGTLFFLFYMYYDKL